MFDSTKEDLKDILKWADDGRLQLPDFQRDYVWGDEDVRSLIASIAKGFPVGALLTLETGGAVSFKPRLLEGVDSTNAKPLQLLLDGQQRMTSLYQATFGRNPVRTKTPQNIQVERYYYLDIEMAVAAGANLEEAIIGVPADRIKRENFGKDIKLDLSTPDKEFASHMFPLNTVFDCKNWFYGWRDYWKARGVDVSGRERAFDLGVVERIARYKMPIIKLDKENSREAICLVFEKVNVGGKKLDAFELVTAIYAADEFDLREDWNGVPGKTSSGRRGRIIGSPNRRDVMAEISSIEFLQACTLLQTRQERLVKAESGIVGKELPQISCRRDALLALPRPAYIAHADAVEKGFIEAASFLNEHKIIWHKDVPYPPQIVAIGSVFAILGPKATTAVAKEKLSRWFWSVVLGELYGSTTESRLARDVPELVEWLNGNDDKPRSIDEAIFQIDRLRSLRSRQSAAYKGVHALMMREGCLDFRTGKPTDIMTFFNDKIDIHHIFPKAWCQGENIPPHIFNSIVNKTPLSKLTNILIGGDAPSIYLRRIEDSQGLAPARLDEILRTHLIEPSKLRADDFFGAFDARIKALSLLLGKAMNKLVVEDKGSNEPEGEIVEINGGDLEEEAEAA